MDTVNIDTTQNVEIEYELANLGDRLLALIIDYLILMGYAFAIVVLSVLFRTDIGVPGAVLLFYIPFLFYFLLFEIIMNGQSPGKKLRKLRVVKVDGTQASLSNYLLRWILWPIDALMSIGLFVVILSDRGQRLGDMAAGTVVIKLSSRVSLADTLYAEVDEYYEPVFANVDRLSAKHIELIKRVLNDHKMVKNYTVLETLYKKTKTILESDSDMLSEKFLETVVKDYNHYLGR